MVTSPRELPQDHFCPWREEAEELRSELDAVQQRLAAIERHLFGEKSEKVPSLARELAKKPSRAETTKTRADRAAVKAKTPTETGAGEGMATERADGADVFARQGIHALGTAVLGYSSREAGGS